MRRKSKALAAGLCLGWLAACGWDPRKPFERLSPEVDRAIAELDGGQPEAANARLSDYLTASKCDGGGILVPGAADASSASFDLGLSLFELAERFGRRFGDAVMSRDGGPSQEEKQLALLRGDQVECARAVLESILSRGDLSPEFEARARYLRGNLAFLDGRWDDAIKDYDKALRIIPGLKSDAGDGVGRDAAWNRALALRHKDDDDRNDAGSDADGGDGDSGDADAADGSDGDADADAEAGNDADADAPQDAPGDRDGSNDGPEDGPKEAASDAADSGPEGGGGDAAGDAPTDGSKESGAGPEGGAEDAGAPAPANGSQDDRILDQFEQAPTWQREEAKSKGQGRKVRGMQDK